MYRFLCQERIYTKRQDSLTRKIVDSKPSVLGAAPSLGALLNVDKEMIMYEHTRKTRGSVIWSSCKPSLLESRDIPVVVENPWYLEMMRKFEADAIAEQIKKDRYNREIDDVR